MLTHRAIWAAIDGLAERYGLTASGLARKAGLDPTTFNRSKRVSRDGKQRWPSTESISKVIEATGATVAEFMSLLGGGPQMAHRIPLIGLAQAGNAGYFDDAGFPTGEGWEKVPFAQLDDENAYALEISGDSMLPVYRDGDTVIVSPAANVRRGDRVIVKTLQGEVMCKLLARRTLTRIELASFNPAYPDRSFDVNEVAWIARILWAAQ